MKSITVDKSELLAKLRENRQKHVSDYEEAKANYRERVVQALRDRAEEIRNGADVNIRFDLPEPVSYEAQYDDAIEMLEWHQEEEVHLEQEEFKNYIQNEWRWSNQFIGVTRQYLG